MVIPPSTNAIMARGTPIGLPIAPSTMLVAKVSQNAIQSGVYLVGNSLLLDTSEVIADVHTEILVDVSFFKFSICFVAEHGHPSISQQFSQLLVRRVTLMWG